MATVEIEVQPERIPEWIRFDGLVQLISVDGQRTVGCPYRELVADVGPEELKRLYTDMAVVRRLDAEAMALQRQGELALWAPLLGQEAAQVGSARRAASGRLRVLELSGARCRLLPWRRPRHDAPTVAWVRARDGIPRRTTWRRRRSSSVPRLCTPPVMHSGSSSRAPRPRPWPISVTARPAKVMWPRRSASPPASSCRLSSSARTTSGPSPSPSNSRPMAPSPGVGRVTACPGSRSTATTSWRCSPRPGSRLPAPRRVRDRPSSKP